jgi:S-(hydroxymethyl)glutathione synthase
MKILETEIIIAASPQAVWSVLDDLEAYPIWNKLVPDLKGRTTVGQTVRGTLVQPNTPDIPIAPTLTRIVGARELRWLTVVPGTEGFSAEHCFVLIPLKDGKTHLKHFEIFDGPLAEIMWSGIDTNSRRAYEEMNHDLKQRSETLAAAKFAIHPAMDHRPTAQTAQQTTMLSCNCTADTVKVSLDGPVYHSHLCGCSQCWKPKGALFALTAIVPAGSAVVRSHEEKLHVLNPDQPIQRYACTSCGAHLIGKVENPDHHFFGSEFIHPELGNGATPTPEFAGYVSSLAENGIAVSQMSGVRCQLSDLGIKAFDAFSPELMDIIAWHKTKITKVNNTKRHAE